MNSCPFCGCKKILFKTNVFDTCGYAFCDNCYARGPEIRLEDCETEDLEKNANEKWNMRVS
jgi:Lar family restriction alleviation protein